jgi:hypothetical protein
MRFAVTIAALFVGTAFAGQGYYDDAPSFIAPPVASSSTICAEDESSSAAAWPTVSSAVVAWPTASSSCEAVTETCTVTVTAPKSWGTGGPWVPAKNATSAAAYATGTG